MLMVRESEKCLDREKDIVRVRDELNAMSDGQYRAWTKDELSAARQFAT
jgi:hypothetical protein